PAPGRGEGTAPPQALPPGRGRGAGNSKFEIEVEFEAVLFLDHSQLEPPTRPPHARSRERAALPPPPAVPPPFPRPRPGGGAEAAGPPPPPPVSSGAGPGGPGAEGSLHPHHPRHERWRNRPPPEQLVVELAEPERGSRARAVQLAQPQDLALADGVAHGVRRIGAVAAHLDLGALALERGLADQEVDRLLGLPAAGVQAHIHDHPARAPEQVAELEQPLARVRVEALLPHQLLAVQRPALGEDGRPEHAPRLRV